MVKNFNFPYSVLNRIKTTDWTGSASSGGASWGAIENGANTSMNGLNISATRTATATETVNFSTDVLNCNISTGGNTTTHATKAQISNLLSEI